MEIRIYIVKGKYCERYFIDDFKANIVIVQCSFLFPFLQLKPTHEKNKDLPFRMIKTTRDTLAF